MDFFGQRRHALPPTQPETLIAFYADNGTDNRGRRLADILCWGVNKLEAYHDYIQTLFPLPERSSVDDQAPIIDRQVFEAFRERADLRDRLRDAFKKILWFYGFELHNEQDKLVVKKSHNYQVHCRTWLTRFDHNHLRITRIIRSLRVLGLEGEAVAFYDAISGATIVSSRSRMYWGRAAHRPLNIRPDIDEEDIVDDDRIGPKFLREFEQAKKNQSQGEGQATVGNGQAHDERTQPGLGEANEYLTNFEKLKEDQAQESSPAITGDGELIEPAEKGKIFRGERN